MANFFKNFKDKKNDKGFLPASIMEQMNSKFENLKYEYDDKEKCYTLIPTLDKIQITLRDIEIIDIENIKRRCEKEDLSFKDLIYYMYNSQRKIRFKPKKHFKKKINDEEVTNEEAFIFEDGRRISGPEMYVLIPHKLEGQVQLVISSGEETYSITCERKPIDSLYNRYFQTKEDSEIYFDFTYNIQNKSLSFNLRPNLKNKNLELYLKALRFVKGVAEGNLKIDGNSISIKKDSVEKINNLEKSILLWEKVKSIEKVLNYKFSINSFDLTGKEIIDIYILYACLVSKETVIRKEKIKNISDSYSNLSSVIKELNKNKEFEMYLEFQDESEIKLFDKSFKLYYLKGYFHLFFQSIEKDSVNQKYIIHFKEDKDKQMYNGTHFFVNENDRQKFMHEPDHISLLSKGLNVIEEVNSLYGNAQ